MNLTNCLKPNIVFVQICRLAFKVLRKIAHDCVDLRLGAIPVFHGESVQREIFYPRRRGSLNDSTGRFRTSPMPLSPWQSARLCPTTIPIHDHRHVQGQQFLCLYTQPRRSNAHTIIVWLRPGPIEAILIRAPIILAIASKYFRAFSGKSFHT